MSANINDPGFSTPDQGQSGYTIDPTGSAWTFAQGAGLSGPSSPFTQANAIKSTDPAGPQVALLAGGGGTISQSVDFGTPGGTYTVSVNAQQRAVGYHQDFSILLDSTVLGRFSPSLTNGSDPEFVTFTTPSFFASGIHTITFRGDDTQTGDNTVFLDQVVLTLVTAGAATVPTIADAEFENTVLASGQYIAAPTGGAWTFGNAAGIAGINSIWSSSNPAQAPDGSNCCYLQGDNASIAQTLNFPVAGTFTISLLIAQRFTTAVNNQDVAVQIDGTTVGVLIASNAQWRTYTTPNFTVTAGNHTLTIIGQDTASGDNTALIGSVTIANVGSGSGTSTPTATPTPLVAVTIAVGTSTPTTIPLTLSAPGGGTAPYSIQFQQATNVGGVAGPWTNAGGTTTALATVAVGLLSTTPYLFRAIVTDSSPTPQTTTSAVASGTTTKGSKLLGINPSWISPIDLDLKRANLVDQANGFQTTDYLHVAPLGADLCPTTDFALHMWDFGVPMPQIAGTHTIAFPGLATLTIYNGTATLSGQAYNAATNTTTATLVIPSVNNGELALTFTNTQRVQGGPTGVGIAGRPYIMRPIAPGSTTSHTTTEVWSRQFLALMAEFTGGFIRFLDPGGANDWPNNPGTSTPTYTLTWGTRKLPGDPVQANYSGSIGLAIEDQVDLCNRVGADFWYLQPDVADAGFFAQVCLAVKFGTDGVNPYTGPAGSTGANPVPSTGPVHPGLNAGLKFKFSWSNETWNEGFDQNGRTGAYAAVPAVQANLVGFDGETNPYAPAYRYPGLALLAMADQAAAVFPGGLGPAYQPILGGQLDNPDVVQQPLKWLQWACGQRGQTIAQNIYGAGGSWYWHLEGMIDDNPPSGATVASMIASGIQTTDSVCGFAQNAAMIRRFDPSLKYVLYEGGLVQGDKGTSAFTTAVEADPGFGTLSSQVLAIVAGLADEFGQYGTTQGAWGLTTGPDNLTTPKCLATFGAIPALGLNGTTVSPAPTTPILADGNFDSTNVSTGNLTTGFYQQPFPVGVTSPWTFVGGAGVSDALGGFKGQFQTSVNTAFIQGTGAISQTFTIETAGSYQVDLSTCQRNFGGSNADLTVAIDGTTLAAFTPASATVFTPTSSRSIHLAAGTHALVITAPNTAGGDNTALINQIALVAVAGGITTPTPTTPAPTIVPPTTVTQFTAGLADLAAAQEILQAINTLGSGQPTNRTIELIQLLLPDATPPTATGSAGTSQPTVSISQRTTTSLASAMADAGAAREIVAAINSSGGTLPSERAVKLLRLIVQ